MTTTLPRPNKPQHAVAKMTFVDMLAVTLGSGTVVGFCFLLHTLVAG